LPFGGEEKTRGREVATMLCRRVEKRATMGGGKVVKTKQELGKKKWVGSPNAGGGAAEQGKKKVLGGREKGGGK